MNECKECGKKIPEDKEFCPYHAGQRSVQLMY